MAIVIANLSPKGGVGKTTVSIMLAGEFLNAGETVAIVDCDPRRNVIEWSQVLQAEEKPPIGIEVIDGTGRGLPALLQAVDNKFDVVVIDSQGAEDAITDILIQFAQIVLVPFQLSQQDVSATITIRNYVQAAEAHYKKRIPLLAILNRMSVLTRSHPAYRGLNALLAKYGVPLARTELWERRPYNRLTANEWSLRTMAPSKSVDDAITNANELFQEIVEHLVRGMEAA